MNISMDRVSSKLVLTYVFIPRKTMQPIRKMEGLNEKRDEFISDHDLEPSLDVYLRKEQNPKSIRM